MSDQPAFPQINRYPWKSNVNGEAGMTLRDYFAAKAMMARIINVGMHYHEDRMSMAACDAETAKRAYEVADAMLKARNKE